jgi:hypothetical protein
MNQANHTPTGFLLGAMPRIALVAIGLMWTFPFLQPYHRFPLTGFYSEWIAFAFGLVAALALLGKKPWQGATWPVIAIAPIGLIVVFGLQIGLGRVPYPEQAFTATLYLLWTSLLMLLAHVLRRDLGMQAVATGLAWLLLAAGTLSVLIALIQHFQVSTPFNFAIVQKSGSQGYGNIGQPNHFASYIALSLVSTLYLYFRRRLPGALAAVCIASFLLVLAVAGSRSPWLYLGTLAALGVLLHHHQRDDDSRRLMSMSLWLIPGFIVANGVAALPFMAPEDKLLSTSAQRLLFQLASGVESRVQLWREAWGMFLSEPILGAGWGQFAWHHFLNQALNGPGPAPGVFNHAHNIVLQLLAETGAIGASIVIGAVLFWLAGLRRVKLDLDWWWLLALLSVIAIHSLLEYPLWYAYFLGMVAVLLGLGAERVFAVKYTGIARIVVGLLVVVGWVNLVAVMAPYRSFERLVFSPQPEHSQPMDEKAFEQSIVGVHREPLLAPYVELAVAYSVTMSEEKLQAELDFVNRAVRFAPVPHVVYRQVLLLAVAGERETALRRLDQAARAYPAELGGFHAELVELARRRPDAFAPLLEWTAAQLAQARAPANR